MVWKLVLFIFAPIFRVGGLPIPLSSFYILIVKNLAFLKSYFYPLLISSMYLLLIVFFNNSFTPRLSDLMLFVFPLIYLVLIHAFIKLKDLTKILKIYFYVNLTLVFITGVLKIVPGPLVYYYNVFIFGNLTTGSEYIDFITERSIGLLGHPAWLALMAYLLGKFLSINEGKYRYVLFSIPVIVLSGGRAALVTLILIEIATMIIKYKKNIIKLSVYIIISLLLFFSLFAAMYYFNSNFQYFVHITLQDIQTGGGEFSSNSISNRVDMFSVLGDLNLFQFLFGNGTVLAGLNVPALDSELVMRTLQFGVIGYLLLFLPALITFRNSKKHNNKKGKEISFVILLFFIVGSITTTIASNMIFVIYISLMIAIVEQNNQRNKSGLIREKTKEAA